MDERKVMIAYIFEKLEGKGIFETEEVEQNLKNMLNSSNEESAYLATKLLEGFVVNFWNRNLVAWCLRRFTTKDLHEHLTKNKDLLHDVKVVRNKIRNRVMNPPYSINMLEYMHPINSDTWLRRLAKEFGEVTNNRYFTNYNDKLYHTHDIDSFRFWLRKYCNGGYYYEFTFDFYNYEYQYLEAENSLLFTRKCDRQEKECICFMAFLGDYSTRFVEKAKLNKGVYNRETKYFEAKNINYIKKILCK